jgi:hypothetical protein
MKFLFSNFKITSRTWNKESRIKNWNFNDDNDSMSWISIFSISWIWSFQSENERILEIYDNPTSHFDIHLM